MILLYKLIKRKGIFLPAQYGYVLVYKDLSSSTVYIRWIGTPIKKKLSRHIVRRYLVQVDSSVTAKQLGEGYKIVDTERKTATYSLVWKYKL